jgi:hypothetical protein
VSALFPSRSDGLIRPTVLLAVVMLAAGTAGAQEAPGEPDAQRKAEARAHLKRGAQLIDAEDLTGALAEFEAAYRLVPSATILHNFGIVYQGLGRKAAALDAFERFLTEAPRAPPETREHARKAVETLRPEVAELRVQSDLAGATIFVDGREVGRTPQEKPIYLDPGPHQLSVEKTDVGKVHSQRIEVGAGQRLAVPARLNRPAAAAPAEVAETSTPAEAPARTWRKPAAWAATVGAAVAGGLFGRQLYRRDQEVKRFNAKECGTRGLPDRPEICTQLYNSAKWEEKWAIVAGVATAALGVGATALFLTAPERPGGLALSLRASGTDLGLGLQGRF